MVFELFGWRPGTVLLLLLAAVEAPAFASVDAAASSGSVESLHSTLSLAEAVRLALVDQPRIDRFTAEAAGARHAAVAAGELPDPAIFGGIRELPVSGDAAYSLTRDRDTQYVIGVMQDFPRGAKRRAARATEDRIADRFDAEAQLATREVRRDAGLAYLALWRDRASLKFAAAMVGDATLDLERARRNASAGTARQLDVLRADLERATLVDRQTAREQAVVVATSRLERWIGAAAAQPLDEQLAIAAQLPSEAEIRVRLVDHPMLATLHAGTAVAAARADAARAAFAPDWRLELGYGSRPEYPDMVMMQVAMDLPLFTRNRQDRRLAAALAEQDAARAAFADAERALVAEALAVRRDVERLDVRLAQFESHIVPTAIAARDAAADAWRRADGDLASVLEARIALLEVRDEALQIRHDAASRRLELDYFLGTDDTNAAEGRP